MFATLCSNPAATNALIGKTIANTLSTTVRPPVASHTARQTKAFARTPRKNTSPNDRPVLLAAVASAEAEVHHHRD